MSIEEKTKEYILKELIPNLGFDIHLEPIVASYVIYKADTSFRAGAEWMLEKAVNWLKSNVGKYPEINWDQQEWYSNKERLIKDFKKTMEE